MKKHFISKLTFSAMLASSLVVVGCGGGGNGEKEIVVVTDANWVGYQADNGEWSTLSSPISTSEDGIETYKFKANEKYGIAFYCSEDKEGNIFYLTKNEVDNFSFYCNEHFNRYSVSGTHNLDEGEYFAISNIDSKTSMSLLSVSEIPDTTNFTISEVPEGKWDLVSVEYSTAGDSLSPYKVVIQRDIEVNNNISNLNVDFSTGSFFSSHDFNVANGEGVAWFISGNNTITLNGIKNDDRNEWFQINNITNSNDSYIFVGVNDYGTKVHTESHPATESGLGDITINLDDILDLTSGSFDSGTKTFSGLNYTPSSTSPDLIGYSIFIENTNLSWDIAISKNWLGTNTSYTLPDLSSVDGFPSGAWFSNFTTLDIYLSAVMSNVDIKNLVQSDPKLDFDYPVLKNGIFEIVSQEIQ